MPASRFRGQIALGNDTASRLLQSLRELFQQKLALNFTTVWRSRTHLHKIDMLKPIGFTVEVFANAIAASEMSILRRACYLGKADTASAAAKMGQAEIASRVAKSSASTANCHLLSCAR